jgi:hypothetical protein
VNNCKELKMPANKPLHTVSQASGNGVRYYDGGKEKFIKSSMLREIQSGVTTHEGQSLKGREARKYMDRHSQKCLGKDLSGSYNNEKLKGYV